MQPRATRVESAASPSLSLSCTDDAIVESRKTALYLCKLIQIDSMVHMHLEEQINRRSEHKFYVTFLCILPSLLQPWAVLVHSQSKEKGRNSLSSREPLPYHVRNQAFYSPEPKLIYAEF